MLTAMLLLSSALLIPATARSISVYEKPLQVCPLSLGGRSVALAAMRGNSLDGEMVGALLPSGGIAVGVRRSRKVYVFSRSGHLLRVSGGGGWQRGQFAAIGWVRAYRGDSIAVYDPLAMAVSIFDSWGEFRRSVRFRSAERVASVAGPFQDGSFALGVSESPGGRNGRIFADTMRYRLYGPNGRRRGGIAGWYRGPVLFSSFIHGFTVIAVPFNMTSFQIASGTHFYGIANRNITSVSVSAPMVVNVVRTTDEMIPVSAADAVTVRRQLLQSLNGHADELRQLLGQDPVPDSVGPYGRAVAGSGGKIWLRMRNFSSRWTRWHQLSSNGEVTATLQVSARDSLLAIGGDRALLLTTVAGHRKLTVRNVVSRARGGCGRQGG